MPPSRRLQLRTLLSCLLGFWLSWTCLTTPVLAAPFHCRTLKGKPVCIDWIKRSAKRYWEYEAVVTVDGKAQPKEIYDCRSRVIVDKDDTAFSFGRNDPGSVVCDLFRERSKSMRLSDLTSPKR
jgi:hypothetical protein